ncbi:MAG: helix-turn-helix transcriptional regulator [Solobacterium sp.]|nr:helix-turn-helix transcriptional regulator [Solobacterium sp.]
MMKSGEFNIVKRLEELLKARDITPYKLGQISSIPHATIYTWLEKGEFPGNEYLLKICKALDITIPEFFNACSDIMITEPEDIRHMQKYHLLTEKQKELIDSSMNLFINEK